MAYEYEEIVDWSEIMKILAIGNSFSQDATQWLQLFDKNMFVRNLYIGGCSLETHYINAVGDKRAYAYEENGATCRRETVSIKEALLSQKWDYVTLQQCSGLSGKADTFYPYLSELIKYVKNYSDAEIVWHQTWAYESDSTHPQFGLYHCDRNEMFREIVSVSKDVAQREGLRMIRTGEAIEQLRKTEEFNYENGGLPITRDGFHLSVNYGRFLAAGVWLKFFTGKIPEFLNRENFSKPYAAIKRVLESAK